MDTAYAAASGQRFPPPLPFHKSLEELRRYFEKFEVPLTLAHGAVPRRAMRSSAAARPRTAGATLLMEEARLSRAEYKIFTDSTGRPLVEDVRLSQRNSRCRRRRRAVQRKAFTRRVGIYLRRPGRILQTRFVNPTAS